MARDELKNGYNEHKSYIISKLKEKFNLTDEETIRYFHMIYQKKVIKNFMEICQLIDSRMVRPLLQFRDIYSELL